MKPKIAKMSSSKEKSAKNGNNKAKYMSPQREQSPKKALQKMDTVHSVRCGDDRPNTSFLERIGNEEDSSNQRCI